MKRIIQEIPDKWRAGNVVVSTYFASKENPQKDCVGVYSNAPLNSFSYFQNWYISVLYQNLKAIIFHDHLSEEFIAQYQNENIIFISANLGNFSLNDERFFIYHEFLCESSINNLLATDISDVFIKKDPFSLGSIHPGLYFGADENIIFKKNPWMIHKLKQLIHSGYPMRGIPKSLLDRGVANAGVIMGTREYLLEIFGEMLKVFEMVDNDLNHNMVALNLSLNKLLPDYKVGYPFTSDFKKYQSWRDVYIVHK